MFASGRSHELALGGLMLVTASCGASAVRVADPTLAPETMPAAALHDMARAYELASKDQVVVVTRNGEALELLDACTTRAIYGARPLPSAPEGPVRMERTLASLDQNTMPDSAVCERATHVVTRIGDDTLEVIPIVRPRLVSDATHVSITAHRGEWSLRSDDGHLSAPLPTSTWMRPKSVHSIVRDADHERLAVFGPDVPEPELHLAIGTRKDELWPWIGIGTAVFGGALTATAIALGPASLNHGGESGSSRDWGAMAGFWVVGLLALAIDGWSLFYLARGPRDVPALVRATP